MTQASPGKKDLTMWGIVLYATVLGAGVRLAMPVNSVAPLNDGGFFYSMILDLQQNNFVLPLFSSYNAAHIPFVYPPLAFYFTALISTFFHLPVFDLLRLLPPVVSALCIPAFYLLAKEILRSDAQVALAVVIFAFIPRTLDWPVMGGGITRSFGLLLALLAMRQLYLMFAADSNRHVPLAILLGALVVCTHPEAAVHTAVTAAIFYLLRDRSLAGLRRALITGAGVAILSAPWWLTALARHGAAALAAPMAAAGGDSAGFFVRLLALFTFNFTDEYFLAVVAVLGLAGLAVELARRQYLLPAWLTALLLVEPRGGPLYMMIPHALMAAVALDSLILPGLKTLAGQPGKIPAADGAGSASLKVLLDGKAPKIVLGYLLLYTLISSTMASVTLLQKYTLKPADLEAFQWVRSNTAPGAQFVLLTGENALRDASSEWFPALTGRRSLATLFGYEWVNDGRFPQRRRDYDDLQRCAGQDQGCLDEWSRDTGQAIDYVYIRKFIEDRPVQPALAGYLSLSNEYEQVYESGGAVIFRHLTGAQ